MLYDMRRLHPRGAANRGICVDAGGAMAGPDSVLVQRSPQGYRGLDRRAAAAVQSLLLKGLEPEWLYAQTRRIADALDKGEIALAQIYGLRIPVGELDDALLSKLSRVARLTKAGYNPDEPRVPKGYGRESGEWTAGDGGAGEDNGVDEGGGGADESEVDDPRRAVSLLGVTSSDGGSSSSEGDGLTYRWPDQQGAPPPAPAKPQEAGAAPPEPGPSTLDGPDVGVAPSGSTSNSTGPTSQVPRPQPGSGSDTSWPAPGLGIKIPEHEPATRRERNRFLRHAATMLGAAVAIAGLFDPEVEAVIAALEAVAWLAEYLPDIYRISMSQRRSKSCSRRSQTPNSATKSTISLRRSSDRRTRCAISGCSATE